MMLLNIRSKLIAEGYEVLSVHKSYIKTPKRLGRQQAHTDKDIHNCWFEWIITHTDFDQAIMETANGRDYWTHVSCKKNRSKNRHQVIRDLRKKGGQA